MEAFVRFRLVKIPVEGSFVPRQTLESSREYFVSWFEPEHLILPLVIPFFIKRFNNMNWSILTPDACIHWNCKEILVTDGESKPADIDDELEDLWREYYANIFNPARLKLKAMESEMPKKYWINLPEASLIKELIRSAGKRTDSMINKGATASWKKTAKSSYVKESQEALREKVRSTEEKVRSTEEKVPRTGESNTLTPLIL